MQPLCVHMFIIDHAHMSTHRHTHFRRCLGETKQAVSCNYDIKCCGFVVQLTVPDNAMQVCVFWGALRSGLTGG